MTLRGNLPTPTLSAETEGKVTNRVRLKRGKKAPAARVYGGSTQTAINRLRADPSLRGREYTQVVISAPTEDVVELDEWCRKTQMTRSAFLRQAAKHFAMKLWGIDPWSAK